MMGLRLQVILVLLSWFIDLLHGFWNFPRARPGGPVVLVPSSEEDIPLVPGAIFHVPRGNKFHMQLSKINEKPPKYVDVGYDGKLVGAVGSYGSADVCCGNEWVAHHQEVPHLVHVLVPTSPRFYGYRKLEDIKPVTEHIEDDLQYDFRTKTHSIR